MRDAFAMFLILCCIALLLPGCSQDEGTGTNPFVLLKTGNEFTADGAYVPVGGKLQFGISGVGDGSPLTNLRVRRTTANGTVTELDKGMFVAEGGIDTTLVYFKGSAPVESWSFFIMNAERDTAMASVTINLGEGSAYGDILYFSSITLGLQSNGQYPNYLDLETGLAYTKEDVAGHEADIDLAGFWYITSGKSSPTLTCPAYSSALTYYPEFGSWPVKNSTLYDYKTNDNYLISVEQFEAAENDSLLVNGYNPANVSGLCKFCYTGNVIPFKTASGKFGLIRVIHADETADGKIEMAIKIQK